jgi:hypothetical protein
MEIFGFAIAGLLALVIAVIGVLMITKARFFGIGPMLNGIFGKLSVIVAILLLVVSIGGAIAYVGTLSGGKILQTGSLEPETQPGLTGLSCVFNSAPTEADNVPTAGIGITFVADPQKLNSYKAYVLHNNGTRSINGTVVCTRTGDINQAVAVSCYAKASSFRSETSTTDSNTYYWVATSASASKVAGFPWAQTIYLNSGAVATTSSDKEKTNLLFTGAGSAQVAQTLGFYVTLPGATPFSYLNNQTQGSVKIYCNDAEVADLTLVKVSA